MEFELKNFSLLNERLFPDRFILDTEFSYFFPNIFFNFHFHVVRKEINVRDDTMLDIRIVKIADTEQCTHKLFI